MPLESANTLIEHLARYRNSDRPAVQDGPLTLCYGELLDWIDAAAARLVDHGVAPGDRILVALPNSAEQIIGVLAVIANGAIAVPVDAAVADARREDVIQQTAPHFMLASADQGTSDDVQMISLRIDAETRIMHCNKLGKTAESQCEQSTTDHEPVAFIRFTSGSTGHAKGVEVTHAQQLWIARSLCEYFGIDAEHRELVIVSMALSGGWQRVAATLYGGGCVIIGDKPLSVGDLLDMLNDGRATGFFTPPPLLRMLLASDEVKTRAALQHCRTIEIGSAAITADELAAFVGLVPDARVFVHYGLTECSRAVVLDAASDVDKLATVGSALPGVELRIVDDAGRVLPCGQVGQVLLRGPQLTRGYWRQPALNQERFVDGWLVTGDYGSVDEDGFLTLRGRHDDMINCGGHCYFPNEVEHALGTPEGIEQYLIAGVPDPRGVLQDIPWAFVVPADTREWTPGEFLARARTLLPAHMVPRQVVVIPGLPLTPSGKPDRRETVKLYATST